MAWIFLKPLLIAIGSIAAFSIFAWLSSRYREKPYSRLIMWLGILLFLGGCWLFGISIFPVIQISRYWGIGIIAFFAVLFMFTAGYFVRKQRKTAA